MLSLVGMWKGLEKFFLGGQVVLGGRMFIPCGPTYGHLLRLKKYPGICPTELGEEGAEPGKEGGRGRERPGQGKVEREGKGLGTEGAGE